MTKYIIHHVEYLDLNHRYYVVIALKKELEDSLFDCHFFDDEGDIKEGDLVLIRKQEEALNGDIVVAFIEGEGNTLKRFMQYGNTIFLHPENPKYTDIPLTDCKIQGVAISVIKKL